jgi:serine/threonine protein kinase/Tol biopolymer transport system component
MTLAAGTKLGPYEIGAPLGSGGMGEVYRARDARLNRTVAIKVLPTSFSADPDRLQRFAQEARAAAALNHPNILSIFDIGEQQGAPYVVSELLEGETLRERLRNGPLSIRKAIEYALQIARGLAAAHEKGIVHRDLKPENLFLTEDGRVKILDFGLAKLTRPETSSDDADAPTVHAATEPGLVMGTAGYMSPEQVRGKPADPRSDIFSFGAILYEMISGKRAFHGDTAADTMSAILKEETPELSETARNVPPGLERIVRHCLEKVPAQRFHSAGDLAFDLEALTDISTTSKSGAQAVAAQVPEAKPKSKLFPLLAALALGIAMLGLGWYIGHGITASAPPSYKQVTFRTGSIFNARFTPDGSIVYSASWDGGETEIYIARTDDTGSRELGLKNSTLLSVSKSGELAIRLNDRFQSGYAVVGTLARVPLSGGSPREVLDNVQDADFASDGENMAVVRYVPETRHWRLEYPVGKVLLDQINWISQPKISPDGKHIAFGDHENTGGDDRGSVSLIDLQGQVKKLSSGWSSIEGVLWAPSGDEIWFSASDTGSANNVRGVTLDGKMRTISNVPGGMWIYDIRNGDVLGVAQHQRVGIRGLAPGAKEEQELGWLGWSELRTISDDGKKVLFEEESEGGGPNYTVYLRDIDGSPPVKIGEGIAVAISPDNKWVITQSAKGGALTVVPSGAGQSRPLTHDNISYGVAEFLPDGKHLLASGIEAGHGGRDYLIDFETGDSKPITPEGISGVHLSPDGTRTVVLGPDGKWGIWTLNGSTMQLVPGLGDRYSISGWTADGTALYVAVGQRANNRQIFRVNLTTGKMDPWKVLGAESRIGIQSMGRPQIWHDGAAYAYLYVQVLSEAYVVKGLK